VGSSGTNTDAELPIGSRPVHTGISGVPGSDEGPPRMRNDGLHPIAESELHQYSFDVGLDGCLARELHDPERQGPAELRRGPAGTVAAHEESGRPRCARRQTAAPAFPPPIPNARLRLLGRQSGW
jgi:hypothetical protein